VNHKLIMENWRNFQERSLLTERAIKIERSPDFKEQKPGMFRQGVSEKKKNKLEPGNLDHKFDFTLYYAFVHKDSGDITYDDVHHWEEDYAERYSDEDYDFSISDWSEAHDLVKKLFEKKERKYIESVIDRIDRTLELSLKPNQRRSPYDRYQRMQTGKWYAYPSHVYAKPNGIIDHSVVWAHEDSAGMAFSDMEEKNQVLKTRRAAGGPRPQEKKSWLQKLTGKE